MFIIDCKKINGFMSVALFSVLLVSSIFYREIAVCAFDKRDLKCFNVSRPSLSFTLGLWIDKCNMTCVNISKYDDEICHKEFSTLNLICNCTKNKRFICNEPNAFPSKCDCEEVSPTLTTILIIVISVILLALLVALIAALILRRRRKALERSQKYTLIARMSSEQQDDQIRKGKSVKIKSFRMAEEHCYEVVLPKGQRISEADQPKVNFDQYLKYIQKDGATKNTDNDTLSFKQKETTRKQQIDTSFKNILTDCKTSSPTHQMSTGYISSLLNSQTEKFKRTRSSRIRKPTGFTLRRTASEWHTDRLASHPGDKTKSYGDLTKVPFYFELERSGSQTGQPGCDESSSVTYDVAKCIHHL